VSGEPLRPGISQQLWRDARREVAASLFHPFVTALGRGDLPREAFQHYVGQDAFFLDAFARAYALAAARSYDKPPEVMHGFLGLMQVGAPPPLSSFT
jgi:thiaminase/transcriptional activator TenA